MLSELSELNCQHESELLFESYPFVNPLFPILPREMIGQVFTQKKRSLLGVLQIDGSVDILCTFGVCADVAE